MWFMNKIVNPFVRLILLSPLHGMMSSALLLITYKGRKSGKAYTLPVQYVKDNRTIYIIPGNPNQKIWWRNLRSASAVQLRLAGKALSCTASVLEGPSKSADIAGILDIYLRRFPAAARLHKVRLEENGSFNQDDINQAASSTVVVRVEM